MTTIHRTGQQANLTLRDTEPRVTPAPPSRQFSETLGEGAHVLLAGVEQAAGFLPGGNAVAAAIRSGQSAGGEQSTGTAGTSGAPAGRATEGGSFQQMLGESANSAQELLVMQHEMATQQRNFQLTSNIYKAEHDTKKAVIQNFR